MGDPRRSNFLPDCNLVATTANGECGAMANPNFGTYVPVNSPDPDWITGWGKRTYNWQTSINVDRELIPNVVVNAGFFRTWYGNFQVTDNLRVTPADYSPYCVTVPVEAVARSMLIEGTTTTDSSSKFFWIESHASPIDSCKSSKAR